MRHRSVGVFVGWWIGLATCIGNAVPGQGQVPCWPTAAARRHAEGTVHTFLTRADGARFFQADSVRAVRGLAPLVRDDRICATYGRDPRAGPLVAIFRVGSHSILYFEADTANSTIVVLDSSLAVVGHTRRHDASF